MTKDLTTGSPLKLIIGFAFPMFLGMVFQQFYSMVDTMIVGKFLGLEALAGVGSTGAINFMVLGFCMGICNGFAIPVAKMFGAKKEAELRRYVANSTWLCIAFSVVLTAAVVIFCRQILTLLNTPADIFEHAYNYIVIIFAGIPCMILYNILAAIIRSLGDSKTPVVFLAVSSVLNIGLDLLFILTFDMGVAGAAWATVLSQGISGVVCLFYMRKKYQILRGSRDDWKIRPSYMSELCGVGVPMGLQYSITAIGSLVVQFAVNGLGATVVAGVTASQKIMQFACCPFDTLGQTMAPYSSQNLGAGRIDRIGEGMKVANICGFIVSAVMLLVLVLGGRALSCLFLDPSETAAIEYSYQFMVVAAAAYCLLTLVNTVRFTIQGMGFSMFAVTAGVMEMFARTLAALALVPIMGFWGIALAHPLAWVFADAFLIPSYFICKKRLQTEEKKLLKCA
ncbi:MAG: MATE family efflux transporter [Lachnospiraceae bacterium]|nr:MATE family efflux transporter [Lachnospiraceae bacterium]